MMVNELSSSNFFSGQLYVDLHKAKKSTELSVLLKSDTPPNVLAFENMTVDCYSPHFCPERNSSVCTIILMSLYYNILINCNAKLDF